MMILRFLTQRLPSSSTRQLVMITGARHTGKTTLVQATYPYLSYISLDEIEERLRLREPPTRAWADTVGPAMLDEAQKEPSVFDKVKAAYDRGEVASILLAVTCQTNARQVAWRPRSLHGTAAQTVGSRYMGGTGWEVVRVTRAVLSSKSCLQPGLVRV